MFSCITSISKLINNVTYLLDSFRLANSVVIHLVIFDCITFFKLSFKIWFRTNIVRNILIFNFAITTPSRWSGRFYYTVKFPTDISTHFSSKIVDRPSAICRSLIIFDIDVDKRILWFDVTVHSRTFKKLTI